MTFRDQPSVEAPATDTEELAAQIFTRRRFGPWDCSDEFELETRLERDPAYADAFRRVEESWAAVGRHAISTELLGFRAQAIFRARRARRWAMTDMRKRRILRMAAGVAALVIVAGAAYVAAPFGLRPGEYRTGIGEQRLIELADYTRIALDADTRLRVRFSKDSRRVQLIAGQAQFTVAKDPARPFKVEAGAHTVVAVGTVFTVEYVDRKMQVAMLEGKVAVLSPPPRAESPDVDAEAGRTKDATPPQRDSATLSQHRPSTIELIAGEALSVRMDGQAVVIPKADLEAATAWRAGKVIFHSEPLGEVVRRLNRYSRLRMQVDDPQLAAVKISGVFDAGDTAAFVECLQSYLPIDTEYAESDIVRLKPR